MRKMPRPLISLLCLLLVLCCFLPFVAAPSEAKANETDKPSNLNITVVVPQKTATPKPEEIPIKTLEQSKQEQPKKEPPTKIPMLYPVDVWENMENGKIEIVKTYELSSLEKPENIPRNSFTKNGLIFELADIIKHDNAAVDKKDHTETVTLNSDTQNVDSIIKLLAPNLEYKSEDGYVGVLELDISSIKTKQAGTKKNNYTVTATREYPHLSSNDASLVPRTVSDNGRTLTLTDVSWKNETTKAVDYNQLPASYCAVATYSASASKTVVTGYTTTALYKGSVSKTVTGKTLYTAHFTGYMPETAYFELEETSDNPASEKSFIVNQGNAQNKTTEPIKSNNFGSNDVLLYIVLVVTLLLVSLNGFIMLQYFKYKPKKERGD